MSERSVDHEFAAAEPLLWRALSALARNGFAANPSDARDLVHDFYVDAWPGVRTRFNSELGTFAAYLTTAFYRFARRRIAAIGSWRQSLVDTEELARHPSDWASPPDLVEQRQQVDLIRGALSRLPAEERSVLVQYLEGNDSSERAVAMSHGLTRYAMRERLLNAIGRIAVDIGRTDAADVESLVAYYLWHEGRSAKNVGALLGISVSNVQRYKGIFAARLLSSIRPTSTAILKGDTTMTFELATLKRVILSPGDKSTLDHIRDFAQEYRALLDESDIEFSESELEALEGSSEWVASVYEAIGGPVDETSRDTRLSDELSERLVQEGQEIGDAFAALLDVLPGEFRLWELLRSSDEVPLAARENALQHASFRSKSGSYHSLGIMGLTPLMFQGAARGLELLFDRASSSDEPWQAPEFRASRDASDIPLIAIAGEHEAAITPELAISQVRMTSGLPPHAAEPMLRWLLSAIDYRPCLIRGYRGRLSDHVVHFERTSDPRERSPYVYDLVCRWASQELASPRGEQSVPEWSISRLADPKLSLGAPG